MFKSLKTLNQSPTATQLEAALLELYRFGYLLMALPVGILGFLLTRGTTVLPLQFEIYAAMCLVFMGLAFYLAERTLPLEQSQTRALRKAVQLSVAPALPALFSSVCWGVPEYAGLLLASSGVVFVLGMMRLKSYAKNL